MDNSFKSFKQYFFPIFPDEPVLQAIDKLLGAFKTEEQCVQVLEFKYVKNMSGICRNPSETKETTTDEIAENLPKEEQIQPAPEDIDKPKEETCASSQDVPVSTSNSATSNSRNFTKESKTKTQDEIEHSSAISIKKQNIKSNTKSNSSSEEYSTLGISEISSPKKKAKSKSKTSKSCSDSATTCSLESCIERLHLSPLSVEHEKDSPPAVLSLTLSLGKRDMKPSVEMSVKPSSVTDSEEIKSIKKVEKKCTTESRILKSKPTCSTWALAKINFYPEKSRTFEIMEINPALGENIRKIHGEDPKVLFTVLDDGTAVCYDVK